MFSHPEAHQLKRKHTCTTARPTRIMISSKPARKRSYKYVVNRFGVLTLNSVVNHSMAYMIGRKPMEWKCACTLHTTQQHGNAV